MSRTWTPEEEQWLRANYADGTIRDTCAALEARFGRPFSYGSVTMKASALGLRKRHHDRYDRPVERVVRWAEEPELERWMLGHDHGQHVDDLMDEFAARWGFRLNRGQVSRFRSLHGTQSRRSGGARRGRPVGYERVAADGCVWVKVAERPSVPQSRDNWRMKHVVAWEEAHGMPVPEGCVVVFADKDRRNCDPSNLMAVDVNLMGIINQAGGLYWDMGSLRVEVARAMLKHAVVEAEMAPRPCQRCGRMFVPRYREARHARTCPDCVDAGFKASGWDRRGDRAEAQA